MPIIEQTEEVLNHVYPDETLKTLALTYLFFYETFPSELSLAKMKDQFCDELLNYNEKHMQRFNLGVIAGEQVTQSLEAVEVEAVYSAITQEIFSNIEENHKDMLIDKLICDDSITDYQIKTKFQEHIDGLSTRSHGMKEVFGFTSLNSSSNNQRYVYYYHINLPSKSLAVFRPTNKKKLDKEILRYFENYSKSQKMTLKVLEDLPKNFLFNSCPDVFLGFMIQKIFETKLSFEDGLRICYYNLVHFIIDDSDINNLGEKMDGSENDNENYELAYGNPKLGSADDDFDDFDNDDFGVSPVAGGRQDGSKPMAFNGSKPPVQEEEDDINFDDDDFDDICDDF
jgi:hypothetical protein